MDFYKVLKSLCEQTGNKLTPLTVKLGITVGAISGWKRGASPTGEVLKKFANHFGVSTDYLLGLTASPLRNERQTVAKESVSELPDRDVAELLDIFNKLDSGKKQRLLGYAESLLDPAVSGADSTVK